MNRPEPVVITGLGVVNSGFWGVEEAELAFAEPDPRPVEVDRSGGYHPEGGPRLAMLVDVARQKEWIAPMAARRMSPASRFAVCAALMAVEDAGLEKSDLEGSTAVILGTAFGAASTTERILRQIFCEGPEAVSPALFTESVANAPAAQIALAVKARGANITVTQRQVSVAVALERALAELNAGRVKRVLVGAVDEMNPLLHAVLCRFGALAEPDDSGAEVAGPFDRDSTGWFAAEGAAVALLEHADVAAERGARARARLVAAGSAFDPTAPRNGWGREAAILAAGLGDFLKRGATSMSSIDRIVCSAGGLREADRLEALLMREVWQSETLPAVLAPAAYAGYHGGAVFAGAVLAAGGCAFGATPGFRQAFLDGGVTPHDGRSLPSPEHTLMITTAAGGSAGWAIIGGSSL